MSSSPCLGDRSANRAVLAEKVDLGSNLDIYLSRVVWSKDGRTLFVQRESRDQKVLDLLAVDPATGASRVLFTETAKTWINLNNDFRPLSDGSLIWGSERTGYLHHLYRWADGRWGAAHEWPLGHDRPCPGVDEEKDIACSSPATSDGLRSNSMSIGSIIFARASHSGQ